MPQPRTQHTVAAAAASVETSSMAPLAHLHRAAQSWGRHHRQYRMGQPPQEETWIWPMMILQKWARHWSVSRETTFKLWARPVPQAVCSSSEGVDFKTEKGQISAIIYGIGCGFKTYWIARAQKKVTQSTALQILSVWSCCNLCNMSLNYMEQVKQYMLCRCCQNSSRQNWEIW
jgi:hypothetical protein